MNKSIICKMQSVDFYDNTITITPPKGFWANYKVRSGAIEINLDRPDCGIINKHVKEATNE